MKPKYAEEIIVGVVNGADFRWFILNKDFCFLDYCKLEEAYRRKGYHVVMDPSPRFGIKVVDTQTKDVFLDSIQDYHVDSCDLHNMLVAEEDYDVKLAYNPSILINFNVRVLFSHYSEPESFEEFVPDGWRGIYQNFESLIPQEERYWLDKSGKSLICR